MTQTSAISIESGSFPSKRYEKVVQLELNELSYGILRQLCSTGALPNFKTALDTWSAYTTVSESEYHLIEPWIQWVTVHTGKTFAEHQIFRLGDQGKLTQKQIWEVLSEAGVETAIIGSMNARRGATSGGVFFADPWAKSNETYPASLAPLWRLISSKVQSHSVKPPSLSELMRGAVACFNFGLPPSLYLDIARQLIAQKIDRLKHWRLAAVFDRMLCELFLSVTGRSNYRFSTLFLNSIAHYQHHYWRNFDRTHFADEIDSPDCSPGDDPVRFGYENFDRILGRILKNTDLSTTLIVITSGLSQEPYTESEDEGGMNYYRLKDHRAFATAAGLTSATVFPLMSRDWQISCPTEAEAAKMQGILEEITTDGEKLFDVTVNSSTTRFMETAVTKQVPDDAEVKLPDGRTVGKFYDLFTRIAVKSGHHSNKGVLLFSEPRRSPDFAPPEVPLTEVFNLGLRALGVRHQ